MPTDASSAIKAGVAAGVTIATAESITGGLVAARLTDVPGASATFRGSVVAYDVDVKAKVLGVSPDLVAREGVVSEAVAEAMAAGAIAALGADAAVATTGVAGPGPHGGVRAGTVVIAAVSPWASVTHRHVFDGDRELVRSRAAAAAISALCEVLDSRNLPGTRLG